MKNQERGVNIELLNSVIQHMPDIILVEDLSHRFVLSNNYTAKLFGYKNVDTMMGIDAHGMRCPAANSAEQFIAQDQKVIQDKRTITLLDIHKYADGNSKVLVTKKTPIFNAQGELTHTLCHCREVHHDAFQIFSMNIAQTDSHFYGNKKDLQRSYEIVSEQDQLSKREIECIFYLLRGKTASQIAGILFLSKRTVENHLANIKQKLNCTKKSELVDYGINQGYLTIIPESILKKNVSLLLD